MFKNHMRFALWAVGVFALLLIAAGCTSGEPQVALPTAFVTQMPATLAPQPMGDASTAVPKTQPSDQGSPTITPSPTLSVPDDAVAAIKDVTGAVLNFSTFETAYDKTPFSGFAVGGNEERYIMAESYGQDGVGYGNFLIPIEQLREYRNDGCSTKCANNMHLTLMNGARLDFTGGPIFDRIRGTTNLGEGSILGEDVQVIEFNPERIKTFLGVAACKFACSDSYAPTKFRNTADVTFTSFAPRELKSVAMGHDEGGCDTNYIPCKPYSAFGFGEEMNVAIGTFTTAFKLSEIESVKLLGKEGSKGTWKIKLRNGEEHESEMLDPFVAGTSPDGYITIFPPILIESIVFR